MFFYIRQIEANFQREVPDLPRYGHASSFGHRSASRSSTPATATLHAENTSAGVTTRVGAVTRSIVFLVESEERRQHRAAFRVALEPRRAPSRRSPSLLASGRRAARSLRRLLALPRRDGTVGELGHGARRAFRAASDN